MRTLLWLAFIAMACGQSSKQEAASAQSASPNIATSSSAPVKKDYTLYNEEFFQRPLITDLTDGTALNKLFADYSDPYTVYYNADGSVWYRHVSTLGALSIECFYFPETKQLYIDYINTSQEGLIFAYGIRVGMSRQDFVSSLKLDTAIARATDRVVVNSESAQHEATFEFDGDRLATVTLTYNYDEANPLPRTLYDLADDWTSIVINESEGQTEMFVACDYKTYRLGTDGGPRLSRINTLMVSKEQESRTDSVTSIVRTNDGFLIHTRDASNEWRPATIQVIFMNDKWSVATWNKQPFAINAVADIMAEEPCGDED
jgi:hypothetical protein